MDIPIAKAWITSNRKFMQCINKIKIKKSRQYYLYHSEGYIALLGWELLDTMPYRITTPINVNICCPIQEVNII